MMTMRFIYFCMATVALSFAAIAFMPAFQGIQQERLQILASADSSYNLVTPPRVATPQPVTLAAQDDPSALANIEPAAGNEVVFTGGFTGNAPAAFSDPAPVQ